jgi:hypothetical protein
MKSFIVKSGIFLLVVMLMAAVAPKKTLRGNWEFRGGIYNKKKTGAPEGYKLERKYTDNHFEAFMLEKDSLPQKYQAADYVLNKDTCTETETYSGQQSPNVGVPIRYLYKVRNDTLILRTTLPSGMNVEEYWRRMK